MRNNKNNGVFYIFNPSDLDRDTYVTKCYQSGTVCMIDELGGFFKDVKIDKNALKEIQFSEQSGELGSQVFAVNVSGRDTYVIVSVLAGSDEVLTEIEGEFTIGSSIDDNTISINGDATSGSLNLSVVSDSDGGFYINAVGNSDIIIDVKTSGSVKVEAGGDLNMDFDGGYTINSDTEEMLVKVKALKLQVEDDFIINGGSRKMVTEDILDVISSIITALDTHFHISPFLGIPTGVSTSPQSPSLQPKLKPTVTDLIKVV